MKDLAPLDEIIIGRVDPHIYAFSTNTIPNYLKVGDTYRPVKVRLEEWKKKYANLKHEFDDVAKVEDGVFFRDYSIHQFLEQDLNKRRLLQSDLPKGVYYSNEFFKDISSEDIKTAIQDIKDDYKNNSMKYQFYDADRLPAKTKYRSTGMWQPRPNQQKVIDNFKIAYENGRTNLLLYAVMRFGKTFTSMCCANEMSAKVVLIVSAKKDVRDEWRKTIESAENFSDFIFVTSADLSGNPSLVNDAKKAGKRVAIFATLQELSGNFIKEKHRELFSGSIDLLLVDETHFGARAEEYGKVLRDAGEKNDDYIDPEKADEQIKLIKSKVRIHLSGTPYRILMSSEFEKEDIIGFYQASDISDEQKAWDEKYLSNEQYEEWDNPYFGYPQMIRFAFTPSKKMRERMESLKTDGKSCGLSELLKPLNIRADDNEKFKKFKYENEVLDLLCVIDGSKDDDELLGLLDYDKIKTGELCHHVVMVLPFCASCDAMEKLIKDNSERFRNLNKYKIINISGIGNKYTIPEIKSAIKQAERENKKTITLTVNRMLTGSTVEEWDTMIYLKDSSSPQEYDQAIFRLQNQFVVDLNSDSGAMVKFNKKPQTLLVDLDPNRVFRMQEERSLIYNASVNKKGRENLEAQIEKDISYSPIIVLNKNHIHRVSAPDLMAAIDNYSRERGIYDEAQEIPVDYGLMNFDDIRKEIEKQNEFRGRNGFDLNYGDDDDSLDIDDTSIDENKENSEQQTNNEQNDSSPQPDNRTIEKQFRTYYSRILFYAALTDDEVKNLKDIIDSINKNEDNIRIAKHLSLDKEILKTLYSNIDFFVLNKLDNTISRINRLLNDKTLSDLDRIRIVFSKFSRLSDSEVVTSHKICAEMVNSIGKKRIRSIFKNNGVILDLASKEAEFALAILDLMDTDKNICRDKIYSIPTSPIAYEFTRKVYRIANLNIDNIAQDFTSYDLVSEDNRNKDWRDLFGEIFNSKGEKMEFDAIVGNPPYQETIGSGANSSLAKQLFPYFIMDSIQSGAKLVSLVTPSRWFSGKAQDGSFIKLREFVKNNNHFSKISNFSGNDNVFNDVLVGSVSYFLYDFNHNGDIQFTETIDGVRKTIERPLFEDGMDIIISSNSYIAILNKVRNHHDFASFTEITRGRNAFGIVGKKSELEKITKTKAFDGSISVRCAHEEFRYADRNAFKDNILPLVDSWKVFTSKGNGGAGNLADEKSVAILGKAYLGEPGSACTDSLIPIGCFESKVEAVNLQKYMSTKFLRFMVGILKVSQNLYQNVYQYVPLQNFTRESDIDWNKSISEIDEQLYKKYKLSQSEIKLIDGKIKPIEIKEA